MLKEKFNNSQKRTKNELESSGVWIKQINRTYYRFFDLIQSGNFNKEWWNTRLFKDGIKKGDTILFWLSGKDAGIYAIGKVISDLKIITSADCIIDYCTPEYYKRFPDGNYSRPHFQCRLIKEFIDNPIYKIYFQDNQILKDLTIIKAPLAGNFKVSKEQWQELKQLYPILNDMD